jgi:hypothetical protein
MHIQVAAQVHNFERRFCWMLSSIRRQLGTHNGHHVSVSVAYVKNTGNPACEEVIKTFRDVGMDIRAVEYGDVSEFQYRGWTRNAQFYKCDADWILFADADMVYPPDFFVRAFNLLETEEFKGSPNCLYSRRFSTTLEETEALVNSYSYPRVIDDPWGEACYLPGKLKSNIGAGYCHLVNVPLLRSSTQPYYCVPGKKVDHSWETYAKAKSDQHFRKRVGGKPIPLPTQIHLQHIRDNELGRHTTLQR